MSSLLWIHLLKLPLFMRCHIGGLMLNVGGITGSHVPSMTSGGSRWLNINIGLLELMGIVVRLPLNYSRGMRRMPLNYSGKMRWLSVNHCWRVWVVM